MKSSTLCCSAVPRRVAARTVAIVAAAVGTGGGTLMAQGTCGTATAPLPAGCGSLLATTHRWAFTVDIDGHAVAVNSGLFTDPGNWQGGALPTTAWCAFDWGRGSNFALTALVGLPPATNATVAQMWVDDSAVTFDFPGRQIYVTGQLSVFNHIGSCPYIGPSPLSFSPWCDLFAGTIDACEVNVLSYDWYAGQGLSYVGADLQVHGRLNARNGCYIGFLNGTRTVPCRADVIVEGGAAELSAKTLQVGVEGSLQLGSGATITVGSPTVVGSLAVGRASGFVLGPGAPPVASSGELRVVDGLLDCSNASISLTAGGSLLLGGGTLRCRTIPTSNASIGSTFGWSGGNIELYGTGATPTITIPGLAAPAGQLVLDRTVGSYRLVHPAVLSPTGTGGRIRISGGAIANGSSISLGYGNPSSSCAVTATDPGTIVSIGGVTASTMQSTAAQSPVLESLAGARLTAGAFTGAPITNFGVTYSASAPGVFAAQLRASGGGVVDISAGPSAGAVDLTCSTIDAGGIGSAVSCHDLIACMWQLPGTGPYSAFRPLSRSVAHDGGVIAVRRSLAPKTTGLLPADVLVAETGTLVVGDAPASLPSTGIVVGPNGTVYSELTLTTDIPGNGVIGAGFVNAGGTVNALVETSGVPITTAPALTINGSYSQSAGTLVTQPYISGGVVKFTTLDVRDPTDNTLLRSGPVSITGGTLEIRFAPGVIPPVPGNYRYLGKLPGSGFNAGFDRVIVTGLGATNYHVTGVDYVFTGGPGTFDWTSDPCITPSMTLNGPSAPVCPGGTVVLYTFGLANRYHSKVDWKLNGVPIVPGGRIAVTQDPSNSNNFSSLLTISGFGAADVGAYTASVTDACGRTVSMDRDVQLSAFPSILVQPQDVRSCSGDPADFSVGLQSDQPTTLQWWVSRVRIDGVLSSLPLHDGVNSWPPDLEFTVSGATAPTLRLTPGPSFPSSDASYPGPVTVMCVYDNGQRPICGTLFDAHGVTRRATWIVDEPLAIAAQPTDAIACPGQPTAFMVALVPTPHQSATSFQWRKDGVNIPTAGPDANGTAATATLQVDSPTASDVGGYDCIISNTCQTVLSTLAQLAFRPCSYEACPADFDGSGGTPDGTDIVLFFEAWLVGEECADVDCSGGTPDLTDIDSFFARWLAGGC